MRWNDQYSANLKSQVGRLLMLLIFYFVIYFLHTQIALNSYRSTFWNIISSDFKKTVSRFNLESIAKATHKDILVPEQTSQFEYFSVINSNFRVLADQNTVLGVNFKQRNVIFKENIVDERTPTVPYDSRNYRVYSMVLDEADSLLLVGGKTYNERQGNILQYDLDTGRLLKDFRLLDLWTILSNCRYNNLCFFGTFKDTFIVLDSVNRVVVHRPVRTSVRHIDGLELVDIGVGEAHAKLLLFVSGRQRDYAQSKTDVFDVTQLILEYAN